MLKKEITYTNPFNGESETETFYFNLTQAEILELEVNIEGGLEGAIEHIQATQNGKDIIELFKTILKKAYGKRSPDGKRFIKSPQDFGEFEASEAYSALFMELVTQADAAANFINGIVPQGLVNENQTQLPVSPNGRTVLGGDVEVDPKPTPRALTQAEAIEMDHEELSSGLAEGRYVLSK